MSSCAPFVARSFALRTAIHLLHLSATSYAQHIALNEFYDGVVGLTDRFAEVCMGLEGRITSFPSVAPPTGDAIPLLEAYLELIADEFAGSKSQGLKNILAELEELTAQTIYKLVNLK